MRRSTISEALTEIRQFDSFNAGTLVGIALAERYGGAPPLRLDGLPATQAAALRASLDARAAGVVGIDTPAYLVYSGGLLVAWCTVRAAVATPDLVLSGTQARHQRLAVQALSDLARQTLLRLADARPDTDPAGMESVMYHEAAVRVAVADDLTTTAATILDPDPAVAEAAIRSLLPTRATEPPQPLVVLDATGFGRYGRCAHRLSVPVLCAIRRIADAHRLPPAVVGDWLDANAGTDKDLPVDDLPAIFDAALVGTFSSQRAYTERHMAEQGWTDAIERAGIPDQYIHLGAVERDLFDHEVQAISTTSTTGRVVAVFRRIPPADMSKG
ncbi:hypothetical protein AB0M79_28275 [Polymorphospora sp. NPDC051019]|uniref:hypothetical protein n=1 Tax=Polymorphospora sp. NPDC051019 TaxID=3155725 RepID=UPI00343D9F95